MEALGASASDDSKIIVVNQNYQPSDLLTDYSAKDAPWDTHRGQSDDVAMIYAGAEGFERYAARIADCSGLLRFGWSDDRETGESRLRLREASFCRVRYCPTCQWRRMLMWQARFYQSLPSLVEAHPRARWIFVTLTVRNCPVTDLRDTLRRMNAAWQRLIKRREFRPVLGWVRTTEVTRGSDGTAHPHFHALLMVPPSWFTGRQYVKQHRWVELWADCMKLDYLPNVDIRAVKPRAPKSGQTPTDTTAQALQGAVAETLKYSTKPADLVADEAWFLELTKQTHRLRFVASGGALKDVLKPEKESDDDMALTTDSDDDDANDDGKRVAFTWTPSMRRYRRFKQGDK